MESNVKVKFNSTYPYCKFTNVHTRDLTKASIHDVVICDDSDNGCGREYLIYYSFTIVPNVLVAPI